MSLTHPIYSIYTFAHTLKAITLFAFIQPKRENKTCISRSCQYFTLCTHISSTLGTFPSLYASVFNFFCVFASFIQRTIWRHTYFMPDFYLMPIWTDLWILCCIETSSNALLKGLIWACACVQAITTIDKCWLYNQAIRWWCCFIGLPLFAYCTSIDGILLNMVNDGLSASKWYR